MQQEFAPDVAQVYLLMTEQLPCTIWTTDRELRFTSIAGAGLAVIGLEPDQLVGRVVEDVYRGRENREEVLAAYKRALLGKEGTYESGFRDRSFVAYVEPLFNNEHSSVIGTLAVALDITGQKRMQVVLERVNRSLSLLNDITQHDARNKIFALKTHLGLLKEGVNDFVICSALDEVDSIVDELSTQIEFAREYQDLGMKKPRWQDTAHLIHNLKTDSIPITADIDGLKIFCDPLLEKVFYNLLDNAVRHGEHATAISVTARENGNQLILAWEDNGIGVPQEIKEEIFNRGFGKNTGLGLFLIREILSINGITIVENGNRGEGARFEMRVPQGAYEFNRM